MELPKLETPEKYTGLYVFDFGDQVAVGYTAREIELLLESERYRTGKVYKIHRSLPDGTLELKGVPTSRFELEDGLFFYRREAPAARADFEQLRALCETTPPPCRAAIQLAKLSHTEPPYVTALLFPAESTDEIAAWLQEAGYRGGDVVEGGPSQVTGYQDAGPEVLARYQAWPAETIPSRTREELYAATGTAVQR
jgi:hypothetical protein